MTYAAGVRAVKPETIGSKTTLLRASAQETGEIPMAIGDTAKDTWNKYSGNLLTGLGALAPLTVLVVMFWLLTKLSKDESGSLALLAIGGVVVLILLLTAVAMVFSILQLTNGTQAMGLPEGSIRAVIALSLIVLFAILSVFLYQGVSKGSLVVNNRVPETLRIQIIREHAAQDVQSVLLKDKDGITPLKSDDGKENLYDVSYRSTNTTADDFAKQMLVLRGTRMTAVTSFYLGAGTATTAAKAGGDAAKESAANSPTVTNIDPTSYATASGASMKLQLTGAHLDIVSRVKIAKAGVELPGTIVSKSATSLTCTIDVSTATSGDWDLTVDDGGSKSFTLPGKLTITA
jgi:hypothetical protein